MLCPPDPTGRPSTLYLALRDLRAANSRHPETGRGVGNESWVALTLAMIVLDTLAGEPDEHVSQQGKNWRQLLIDHQVERADAEIAYALRCSLLHGYGIPRQGAPWTNGRRILLTPGTYDSYAIDTRRKGLALISVPIFCSRLTERIAYEAQGQWDVSLVDVTISLESLSSRRNPLVATDLGASLFRLTDTNAAITGHSGDHAQPS